jgi:hypothetical protein
VKHTDKEEFSPMRNKVRWEEGNMFEESSLLMPFF